MKVIDIHTHGIGGSDTRSASVDAVLGIAQMQGAAGVSEILLSIYPGPVHVMRRQIELVRQAMEHQRSANSGQRSATARNPATRNPRPTTDPRLGARQSDGHRSPGIRGESRSARIMGVYLEGPFLNPARCGALDSASFVEPRERALRALIDGFEDVVKVITIAPELDGAPALIRRMADRGITASMGHSDATYSEAEKGWHAGARGITHLFNAMRSLHHREPGITGFGLVNPDIYVEVIADPFHLHPATLRMIFTMKRPERIVVVSDAVKETRTGGKGRAVASARGVLLGGSMTVTAAVGHLIRLGFDELVVWKTVTTNPAQYLRP